MQEKIDELLKEPLAQKVLFFNEMLTPSLVRTAYWLCLLAVAWVGLGHMFSGGFGHFIEGIVYIVTGAILARIAAELIIVLFKLQSELEQIVKNTETPTSTATKPVRKKTKKVAKKVSKKS